MSGDPSMTREQLREAVVDATTFAYEQTQRIAALEVEVERLTAENDVRLRIIERLRETLAFYADQETNDPNDMGERARRALHHDTGRRGMTNTELAAIDVVGEFLCRRRGLPREVASHAESKAFSEARGIASALLAAGLFAVDSQVATTNYQTGSSEEA